VKVLFIFGTRPEAIKLCPVVRYMTAQPDFDVSVAVTAQHRDMLDQVLRTFEVRPDYDLSAMVPSQTLYESTARILSGLGPVVEAQRPDWTLVQGDTTTTLCGALSAFYSRVPVAHVEAGLRTGDIHAPFPEEMNRVLVTRLANLHFAATQDAAQNLRAEGVRDDAISVTGNSGIDAVLHTTALLKEGKIEPSSELSRQLHEGRKIILVTAHRRESFGQAFDQICQALIKLAQRHDVQIVYPVHPNPSVNTPVRRLLSGNPNIVLTEPLDYIAFIDLLQRSTVVLTDSGGLQEECPSLGKPVLVLRDKTERPEAVEAGSARLVGTNVKQIVSETALLLDDRREYTHRSKVRNIYGDGQASQRIVEKLLSLSPRRP
jgi:UDP-N-acetylglucosamine 2-epimerase (non-hydrolysing)